MQFVRLLDTSTSMLGPGRVEAIAGTSNMARDGHIVDMRGMEIGPFLRTGVILWGHDPNQPVGNPVSGYVDPAGNLRITIDFAPDGVSERADEIRRLVKSGVVRSLSICFESLEMAPLDRNKPKGGQRITRSALLEVSFVSVPADIGAMVTARAAREGKALSGRNATAIREAHNLAERCRSAIAGVLADAGEDPDGDHDDAEHRRRVDYALRQRELEVLSMRHPPMGADYERRMRELDLLRLSAR